MRSHNARRKFEMFNRRYWDGALTVPEIVVIPAGMQGRLMSRCADWGAYGELDGKLTIELRALDGYVHKTYLNANLLHEMIHHRIGLQHAHNSRKFRNEVRRISGLGALIEVI